MKCAVLFRLQMVLSLVALTGCSFLKPSGVAPRLYVLSAMPAGPRVATPGEPRTVGIGYVHLPDYLLTRSIATRQGNNEIVYLQNARWAERLDRGLQRTLGANLASMHPEFQVRFSAWRPQEVSDEVHVAVDRLEVNAEGTCVLEASWRISASGGEGVRKAERFSATRQAADPHSNPDAAIQSFNMLVAELSEAIAHVLAETPP